MAVAGTALAIGPRFVAFTGRRRALPEGVEAVGPMTSLMTASDHLVLALPLTPATRGIVDAASLAAARAGLHLVNVARGALIVEAALLEALDAGRIAAATLDATDPEPLPAGHPSYSHPAIRPTPRVCGRSEDNEERLSRKLLANLDACLAGRTLGGVVDAGRGHRARRTRAGVARDPPDEEPSWRPGGGV